jgi:hypothetical protein
MTGEGTDLAFASPGPDTAFKSSRRLRFVALGDLLLGDLTALLGVDFFLDVELSGAAFRFGGICFLFPSDGSPPFA